MKTNILFTCVGRRTYLLNYFKKELDKENIIVGADMELSAPALTVADYIVEVPPVYDKNYIDILLSICREYEISALISLNDLELPILSDNEILFQEIGVKLIVSSPTIIDICFDKIKTAQFIKQLNLNTPLTFMNMEETMDALNKNLCNFPLVLKPRWGSASIGIEYAENFEELKIAYDLLKYKLQRSILANVSGSKDNILIQEKICGKEYGLDVINDLEGNHFAVIAKQKLAMRAGETDKAIIINNEELNLIGSIIGNKLKHVANLDCDILEQNGKYYVLEMNPRFGGGYPFSHEAGANLPRAIIKWLRNEKVDDSLFRVRINEMYAKNDYLLRVN